ncbi:MAG: hypothetical protein VKK04_10995, partial [Synechococcales bacterium]|nr:hypothetical protein [Synechococcales bacterium]
MEVHWEQFEQAWNVPEYYQSGSTTTFLRRLIAVLGQVAPALLVLLSMYWWRHLSQQYLVEKTPIDSPDSYYFANRQF